MKKELEKTVPKSTTPKLAANDGNSWIKKTETQRNRRPLVRSRSYNDLSIFIESIPVENDSKQYLER